MTVVWESLRNESVKSLAEMQHLSDGIKRPLVENVKKDHISQRNRENDNVSPSKRAKFERTFVPSWLEKYDWLRYDSESNHMYCVLCIKYQKSNAFTEGCQNFRRDNLNKHINTNDHRASCRQEKGDYTSVVPVSLRSPSSSSQGPRRGSDPQPTTALQRAGKPKRLMQVQPFGKTKDISFTIEYHLL